MSAYAVDVATLARKDVLLELRSRDTLPAMLLFVVSALVVFHFALPADASDRAEIGLFWIALIFTALLGLTRAFAAEREHGLLDGLVLAPVDRSAIWAAKVISVVVFLSLAEAVALPAYALFFQPVGWELVAAVALADAALPAAGDSCGHRRRRRLRGRESRFVPGFPRPVRRRFCDPCVGQL